MALVVKAAVAVATVAVAVVMAMALVVKAAAAAATAAAAAGEERSVHAAEVKDLEFVTGGTCVAGVLFPTGSCARRGLLMRAERLIRENFELRWIPHIS
jgi:hypothetical protein